MRSNKINISVIMYGGLSYGGAHRQVIRLLCFLNKDRYNITYFWCKPNSDIGSTFVWPELDYSNIDLMQSHGINVVEFNARTRDVSKKFHPWIDTDFFQKYRKVHTDLVFASRGGYAEYPFIKLSEPIVEWNIFGCADSSRNLVFSAHISDWSYGQWSKCSIGIDSEIIYPAVPAPAKVENFRNAWGLGQDTVVLGFHQRQDDHIYGEHALRAYAKALPKLKTKTRFVIVGGSEKYKSLAEELSLDVLFIPVLKNYEDISAFLKTIDIFTHSGGAGEAHGTVIQEAMMHGLPVVTMLLPDKPNGQVGTLGGVGKVVESVDEYYRTIVSLIENPTLRNEIGNKSREAAEIRFSTDTIALKFEKIFEDIFSKYSGKKLRPSFRDILQQFVFGSTIGCCILRMLKKTCRLLK